MRINSKYLFLIASIIWMIPGIIITRRGFMTTPESWGIWRIVGAVLTLAFFLFIFTRMTAKNKKRINSFEGTKQSVFNTFELKTWIIIIFMILLGVVLRLLPWNIEVFVAFFYPGLGIALLTASIIFFIAFIQALSRK